MPAGDYCWPTSAPTPPKAPAEILRDAGFDVTTAAVDVGSWESVHALVDTATALGNITRLIPRRRCLTEPGPAATILRVDLYETALVLEEFGNGIAAAGAGVVIASQSGHRLGALSADEHDALATAPTDELLSLAMLRTDLVSDPLHAYQLSKRANSLRVMAEAVRWGRRAARGSTPSAPGSSSPRWPGTSSADHAATAIDA